MSGSRPSRQCSVLLQQTLRPLCHLRERLHPRQEGLSLFVAAELSNLPLAATEGLHQVQGRHAHDRCHVLGPVHRTLCPSALLRQLLHDLCIETADPALAWKARVHATKVEDKDKKTRRADGKGKEVKEELKEERKHLDAVA